MVYQISLKILTVINDALYLILVSSIRAGQRHQDHSLKYTLNYY